MIPREAVIRQLAERMAAAIKSLHKVDVSVEWLVGDLLSLAQSIREDDAQIAEQHEAEMECANDCGETIAAAIRARQEPR